MRYYLPPRRVWHGIGLVLVFTGMLTAALIPSKPRPYDDTDDQASGTRAGLTLYTDHLTGCQYIGLGNRAITPRLDTQGHPICKH